MIIRNDKEWDIAHEAFDRAWASLLAGELDLKKTEKRMLKFICQFNDPNGEYADCTKADLIWVIENWMQLPA